MSSFESRLAAVIILSVDLFKFLFRLRSNRKPEQVSVSSHSSVEPKKKQFSKRAILNLSFDDDNTFVN